MTGGIDWMRSIAAVLDPDRVERGAKVELREDQEGSKCRPCRIESQRGEIAALRIRYNEHLPVLKGGTQGFRKLPDYLLWRGPTSPPKHKSDVVLQVLICELKSSAAGVEDAVRQVELGRYLLEYIVSLASYGQGTEPPTFKRIQCCGLIVLPNAPRQKSLTRAPVQYPRARSSIVETYEVPDNSCLYLEQFFV